MVGGTYSLTLKEKIMNVITKIGKIQAVRWDGKKFEGEIPDWLMHLQRVGGELQFDPPWAMRQDELMRHLKLTVKSILKTLETEELTGFPGDYIVKEDVSDEDARIRIISSERFSELYDVVSS
jgi:hypothetical protein